MKKVLSIITSVILVFVIGACGSQESTSQAITETAQSTETSITDVAVYEDTQAKIQDAEFFETEDGESAIRVNFEYTNNTDKGLYMLESFIVRAYQNNKGLDDLTNINDDSDSAELIREVKDGASVKGSYVFRLSDDSDVEVRVCTPTAEEELLAQKIFTK